MTSPLSVSLVEQKKILKFLFDLDGNRCRPGHQQMSNKRALHNYYNNQRVFCFCLDAVLVKMSGLIAGC